MWVGAFCFFTSTSVILGCVLSNYGKNQDNKKEKQKKGRLGYASTDIH